MFVGSRCKAIVPNTNHTNHKSCAVILFYVYSLCQKVYDTEVYNCKYITLRDKLTVVQLSDIIPTLYVAQWFIYLFAKARH